MYNKVVEVISPERAQELINNQWTNRELSEEMVSEMLEDLQNGEFDKDQANIAIRFGKLWVGQHILTAIMRYGKPVEINVYYVEKSNPYSRSWFTKDSKYKYNLKNE